MHDWRWANIRAWCMWIRIDIWGIGHYGVYWYLFFVCRGWLRNEVGCWTVGGLDMEWWFCGLMDGWMDCGHVWFRFKKTYESFHSMPGALPFTRCSPCSNPCETGRLIAKIMHLCHSAAEEMSSVLPTEPDRYLLQYLLCLVVQTPYGILCQ